MRVGRTSALFDQTILIFTLTIYIFNIFIQDCFVASVHIEFAHLVTIRAMSLLRMGDRVA